jgi:glycosyltransferase involved in cell wall biosynthesis
VVLAFLESCSTYAELAALPFRKWGLVVSERSAFERFPTGSDRFRKWLHLVADVLTTNSHTNRLMLEAMVPALGQRMVTVYNAVDFERFKPGSPVYHAGQVRLVTAARFNKQKNVLRAIEAIDLVRHRLGDVTVSVDWFGRSVDEPSLKKECIDLIRQKNLGDRFRMHDETRDIFSHYQQADAVFLPSLFEGIPNMVCESMACGKPILMSAVCDAGSLVKDGENGFLFSPEDPADMADAVAKFALLTAEERLRMGAKSRKMAEEIFDIRKYADAYEAVLYAASRRQRPFCEHWLPEIPQTALDSVKRAGA